MSISDTLMKDAYPSSDSVNAMELASIDRRFEQLIERRERITERSRFGLLALNGASVAGVLSSFSTLTANLSLDPLWPLAFFTVGMIFTVASIFFETNFLGARASQAYGHLMHLRTVRAVLDDKLTDDNEQRHLALLQTHAERAKLGANAPHKIDIDEPTLPNDFAYSPAALTTLNFGGSAWIGGALIILFSAFGWR